ncbi:MAG: hypothetical protein IMF12_02795 [Proteobacteria bacterium]|nr:hypothetical protein [Pseudomonadota bacterium]
MKIEQGNMYIENSSPLRVAKVINVSILNKVGYRYIYHDHAEFCTVAEFIKRFAEYEPVEIPSLPLPVCSWCGKYIQDTVNKIEGEYFHNLCVTYKYGNNPPPLENVIVDKLPPGMEEKLKRLTPGKITLHTDDQPLFCLGCDKSIGKYEPGFIINGDTFHSKCTPEGDPDYTKILNDIVNVGTPGHIDHNRDAVMSHNVGDSNYAEKRIQPWDIWEEYELNAWDADIVKRVLRDKSSQSRRLDYEKIIHVCQKRISQIDKVEIPEAAVCNNCCIFYEKSLTECPECEEGNEND